MPPKKKKPRPPIALSDEYRGVSLQFKNGSWHVRWRDPIDRSPKSRIAGTTAGEVQAAVDAAMRQLNGGRTLRSPQTKTWDVIEDWFTRQVIPKNAHSTMKNYESVCSVYLSAIGDRPIGKVTAATLDVILQRLEEDGRSSAVRDKLSTVLRSLFKWAKREGYVLRNPAADLPEVKRVPVRNIAAAILTMREMLAIASVAEEYYRVHIKTLAFTGMRIGELAGVRRVDCHFHDGCEQPYIIIAQSFDRHAMKAPKNGEERFVYVPAELANEIELHIAAQDESGTAGTDGLVFTAKVGAILHDSNFRIKVFRVAYESAVEAGLVTRKALTPFPHVLRHGIATSLREQGVSEQNTGSHLGHKSAQVTRRYVHETDEGRMKALEGLEAVLAEIRRTDIEKAEGASEVPE